MTIAGSDCSGGAGAQADLKVFQHFGLHGLSAMTCVVAETPLEVGSIHPVPPKIVAEQVSMLLRTYPVAAVKTGMLYSRAHIEAVAEALDGYEGPLVVDPVMVASTGDALIEPDAIDAYKSLLFPKATVITPNLDEAAKLASMKVKSKKDMEVAAITLWKEFGVQAVVKGGHLKTKKVHNIFFDGSILCTFSGSRVETPASHGTGCTFAAVLASQLALGEPEEQAVGVATTFLAGALYSSRVWENREGRRVYAINQDPPRNP
jgi:hydroxymethylpyrimidine/phosphomethylpyrimidine kinase